MFSLHKILLALFLGVTFVFVPAWAEDVDDVETTVAANAKGGNERCILDAGWKLCPQNDSKVQLHEVDWLTQLRWGIALFFPGLVKNEFGILVYEPKPFLEKIREQGKVAVLVIDKNDQTYWAWLNREESGTEASNRDSHNGSQSTGFGSIKGFGSYNIGESVTERHSEVLRGFGTPKQFEEQLNPGPSAFAQSSEINVFPGK